MARRISWTRQSQSDIKKLSKQDVGRIRRAVEQLAGTEHGGVERLEGFNPPAYGLPVGDWRVRFCYEEVGRDELGISVERVLHRREAYRRSGLVRQEIPEREGLDGAGEMQERISVLPRASQERCPQLISSRCAPT